MSFDLKNFKKNKNPNNKFCKKNEYKSLEKHPHNFSIYDSVWDYVSLGVYITLFGILPKDIQPKHYNGSDQYMFLYGSSWSHIGRSIL